MPIIKKIDSNGTTTYEGLENLEDVGWADELRVARGDREHVLRALTRHHLFATEKHKRQCALLLAVVKNLESDDSRIDEVITTLAEEVCTEAELLATWHPLAGLDLEVGYDMERYVWTAADGGNLDEAISNCRMAHIRDPQPEPEPVKDTPAAAKLKDKARKQIDEAIKLNERAQKLNERVKARKTKRAA